MTSPIQADDPHMLQDELWLAMELCISYLGLILTDLHVLHQLHTPLPPGLKYTRRSALCCLVSLKFPVVACWLLLVAACNPDAICLQSRHNLIPVFPPSISLARSLLPYLARSLPPSLSRSLARSLARALPPSHPPSLSLSPRSRHPSLAPTLPLPSGAYGSAAGLILTHRTKPDAWLPEIVVAYGNFPSSLSLAMTNRSPRYD